MNANETKTFCTTETTTILRGKQDHGFNDDKGRAFGHLWSLRTFRTGDEVTQNEAQDTCSYVRRFNSFVDGPQVDFWTDYYTAPGYEQGTPNTTRFEAYVHATRDGEAFGASKPGKLFACEVEALAWIDRQMEEGRKRAAKHKKRDLDVVRPRIITNDAPEEVSYLDNFHREADGKQLVRETPEIPEGATVKDYR